MMVEADLALVREPAALNRSGRPWCTPRDRRPVSIVTADPLGVLVAFGAGILSFLSPCVLPLVPGYVSMVSGLSAAELEAGRATRRRAAAPLAPLLRGIGLFIAGFTVVFVALGAAASGLGHLLGTHKEELTTVAGGVVVVTGRGAAGRRAAGRGFWARARRRDRSAVVR